MKPSALSRKLRQAAKRKMTSETEESKSRAAPRVRIEEQVGALSDPSPSLQVKQKEGAETSQAPQVPFGSTLSEIRAKALAAESLPSLGSISEKGFELFQTEEISTAVGSAEMPEKIASEPPHTTEVIELNSSEREMDDLPATTSEVEAEILSVEKVIFNITNQIAGMEDRLQQPLVEENVGAVAEKERTLIRGPSFELLAEENLERNAQGKEKIGEEIYSPLVTDTLEEEEATANTSAPTAEEVQGIAVPSPSADPDTTLALNLPQEGLPASSSARVDSTNESILAVLRSLDQSVKDLAHRVKNVEDFIMSRGDAITFLSQSNPMSDTVEHTNF